MCVCVLIHTHLGVQRFVGELSIAVAEARASSSHSGAFDPQVQSELAQALLEQGRLTDALKLFRQILKADIAQYGLIHLNVAKTQNKYACMHVHLYMCAHVHMQHCDCL